MQRKGQKKHLFSISNLKVLVLYVVICIIQRSNERFRKPRERNMRVSPGRKLKFQAPYTQSGILLLVCGLSCYFWATRLQAFMKIQTWRILLHWDALMHTHINSHTHIFFNSKVKPEESWDFLHTSLHGAVHRKVVEGEKEVEKYGQLSGTDSGSGGGHNIYEASIN